MGAAEALVSVNPATQRRNTERLRISIVPWFVVLRLLLFATNFDRKATVRAGGSFRTYV